MGGGLGYQWLVQGVTIISNSGRKENRNLQINKQYE
jgi:hypothetical protein